MGASLFAPDIPAYPRYARVVLERGIDHPEGLTYGVPESIGVLAVGDRVEATLGRGDSAVAGYVFEVMTDPGLDPGKIKPIRRRTGLGLPARLVELAEWIARYYCTPLGMVLSAMAPAAAKRAARATPVKLLEPTGLPTPEGARLSKSASAALEALLAMDRAAFPLTIKAARDAAGCKTSAPIERLAALGLLRIVEQPAALGALSAWRDRGLPHDARHALTAAQQSAVNEVAGSLGSFRVHLLRGVTGSGKTEVYLRAMQAVLERGERAIVLVPEISLTPQTVGRFLARVRSLALPGVDVRDAVAVLHSGLTPAQRSAQWFAAASGAARVVIGARSAVFAPFPSGARVGLVIVDEEHEDGYKQDQLPRYHARDVAIRRAQLEGCPALLGSATPSLESWRHAIEGKYTLLELPERVGGASLPRVEIVDLAQERRSRPWTDQRVHLLGPRLEHAIGRTLRAGHQVILLLNRRGWGNYICCPDHRCGWVMACESCDAPMVYHKSRLLQEPNAPPSFVRCHHCLSERTLPRLCPLCAKRVTIFGMGTQRVEEELTRIFPELIEGQTMLRLDGDSVGSSSGGRKWFEALERFGRGDIRLLLGTQMIAKGLDFPNVRLVGVVNADTALNFPDFRSAERTFQLVSQVAGRAGRPRPKATGGARETDDLVLVQTFAPSAAPIVLAAAHDYRAFAEQELALRKGAGLPPYTRMARIVVRHTNIDEARAHAERVGAALREAIESGDAAHSRPTVRLRGPMPCPIARINDYHRIALELTARTAADLQRVVTHARNRGLLKSDAATAVDIDPMALL